MDKFDFKRGDTFIVQGTVPIDLTGYTVSSQVYDGDNLLATLSFSSISNSSTKSIYTLSCADTTSWPLRNLYCDIKYVTPSGQILHTETFIITCIKSYTV